MHKSWVWTSVKITSVAFNSISTYNVFYAALQRSIHQNILFFSPDFVVVVGVILAVLLIDVLFIALVNFLEAPLEDDELYRHRQPYAVGLLMLYVAIVLIGMEDEGLLALAPRVGLGIITLVSWMRYVTLVRWELDQTWEEEFQKRRFRREKRATVKLLEAQRKIKHQQQMQAIRAIQDEIKDKYIKDLRRQMNLHQSDVVDDTIIDSDAISVPQLGSGDLEQLIDKHFNSSPIPIDENIYQYGDYYYFYSPYTGQIFYLTVQGTPYRTLAGVRRAYGRHRAKYER